MLYRGKRLHEMSEEDLEDAELLAIEGMRQAALHYELNRAAYLEIAEEQAKRNAGPLN